MKKNEVETIQQLAEELLGDLGLTGTVKVSALPGSDGYSVEVESPDSNLLIGYHAEALNSFQLILGMMVHKKLGEWYKTIVNVGDYRQRREEQLRSLALSLAQKAKFSKETQMLTGLTAAERRIVHLVLADDSEITTESEGEGRERRLLVKPRQ